MNTRTWVIRLSAGALLAGVFLAAGCQTVKGAGEDLKRASENTERAISGDKSSEGGETGAK